MKIGIGTTSRRDEWSAALHARLPDAEVVMWDEATPPPVEHLVTWHVEPTAAARCSTLRSILLTGAGFDHLDLDRLPDVPIVRLADPAMSASIAEYCLAWVIHFERNFDVFATAQRTATWVVDETSPRREETTVGILGMGTIGSAVAGTLEHHGFGVLGWSRSDHDRPLLEFLRVCDVVVSLVPGAPETHHLLSTAEFDALGSGVLINVGRGTTVDTEALTVALDGPLRAAVLDVFPEEPLPRTSPLWHHPKVMITPHISGPTNPRTASEVVAANILRIEAGATPFPLVRR